MNESVDTAPLISILTPMITENSKAIITKGCAALNLTKGVTVHVKSVTELGPDYGHNVRLVLQVLNGFSAGKTVSLYARHKNRLADADTRLNNGDPTKVVIIRGV